MVSSAAKNASQYLAELPPERRAVMAEMRKLILASLPPGYAEAMGWGMLCYTIPLARYPDTYNGDPLCYVALAAQKNGFSIYLTGPYMLGEEVEEKFRAGFAAAGKKLDMGKSCVRFRKVDDLALPVIAESISSVSVDDYIRHYERVRAKTAAGRNAAAKKVPPKKAPAKTGKSPVRKSAISDAGKRAATGKTAARAKRGRG